MSYSLSFSKAIMVVIYISDKIRQGQFEFLSTKTIAEVLDIPRPTLVKILQSLTNSGIIETREGKGGGIRLLKKTSDITILDILKAVESGKSLFHTNFHIKAIGQRPDNAQKSVVDVLNNAENQLKAALAQKTIAEILNEMND